MSKLTGAQLVAAIKVHTKAIPLDRSNIGSNPITASPASPARLNTVAKPKEWQDSLTTRQDGKGGVETVEGLGLSFLAQVRGG